MSKLINLQKPLQIGSLQLKNRIVMASMTRNRSPFTVPDDLTAEYYYQRAGAGLILSEGALITAIGSEWPNAPGIYNQEHVEGWKKVTDRVHSRNSKIFVQLWHIGRVAHPLHQSGLPALSPSGIGARGGKFRLLEGAPSYVSKPKAIPDPWVIIEQYKSAARNAIKAGFDGVELHAANGYLPNQFIEQHSNQRQDEWGGSAQNRAKFVLETVKALIEVYGGDSKKVGIKLSPAGGYNDMGDPEDIAIEEYSYIISELNKLDIAYVQLVRYTKSPYADPHSHAFEHDVIATYRHLVKNPVLIANNSYTGQEADEAIASGQAGAVSFGIPFINNPDFPERLFNGEELDKNYNPSIWYIVPEGTDASVGYTDFPRKIPIGE